MDGMRCLVPNPDYYADFNGSDNDVLVRFNVKPIHVNWPIPQDQIDAMAFRIFRKQQVINNDSFFFQKGACFIFFVLLSVSLQATVKYTINEGWEFRLDGGAQWEVVNLPHTWNNKDAVDDVPGYYRGVGWYRKSLFIDSAQRGKVVSMFFRWR